MNETNKQTRDINTKAPIIENSMSLSKDGKWFIHKTTITSIKPTNYIKAVLKGGKDE